MSALDRLLRHFSGLEIRSTQVIQRPSLKNMRRPPPDVPAAKRLRVKNSFGGTLSPTRYAGSVQQTRSIRLDVIDSVDIAASLCQISDPVDQILVTVLALPDWRLDTTPLRTEIQRQIETESRKRRWRPEIAYPPNATAMLQTALTEIRAETACKTCNGCGQTLDVESGWHACPDCSGTGHQPWGWKRRWPVLSNYVYGEITEWAYRRHWDEPLNWLVQHLLSRLDNAWADIRST